MTNAYFENLSYYKDVESLNAYHELVEELGESHEKMMRYLKAVSRDNARTQVQTYSPAEPGFLLMFRNALSVWPAIKSKH